MNQTSELEAMRRIWDEYRELALETQSSAASKVGMKQGAFNQYLTGKMQPKALFILRFCKLTNRNPTEIRPSMDVIFGKLKGRPLNNKLDKVIEAIGSGTDGI